MAMIAAEGRGGEGGMTEIVESSVDEFENFEEDEVERKAGGKGEKRR